MYAHWNLPAARRKLDQAGLRVGKAVEASVPVTFGDVGAVVQVLRRTPWQIPDFTVAAYEVSLRALHEHLQRQPLVVHAVRFLLTAGNWGARTPIGLIRRRP